MENKTKILIKKLLFAVCFLSVSVIADGKVDGRNVLIPKGEIQVLNIKSAQILSHTQRAQNKTQSKGNYSRKCKP